MELNLETARLAREVEKRIKEELARLPRGEQESVLARVAVDVLQGDVESPGSEPRPRPAVANGVIRSPEPSEPSNGKKQWEEIVAYCRAHPTVDGLFHNADIAQGLWPDKAKQNRNLIVSSIHTTTKRRSIGESDDPYFVILGKGRFRLATVEERGKAKEKLKD